MLKRIDNADPSRCPVCGSSDLDYGHSTPNLEVDEIYFSVKCKEGGIDFREYYTMEFDASYVAKLWLN